MSGDLWSRGLCPRCERPLQDRRRDVCDECHLSLQRASARADYEGMCRGITRAHEAAAIVERAALLLASGGSIRAQRADREEIVSAMRDLTWVARMWADREEDEADSLAHSWGLDAEDNDY